MATGWLQTREAGTLAGIRFVVLVGTLLGRRVTRALIRLIVLYWTLFSRRVRRNSRLYLARILPRVTFRAIHRHVEHFALCVADRLFMLRGKLGLFDIRFMQPETMDRLRSSGEGAILLGAHLGSFEVMRSSAHVAARPLNIVGYFRNAATINRVLQELNPDVAARVIHADPADPGFVLELKDRVEAGEWVAILGDRVGLNDRSVSADFLGDRALFPAGPYIMASLLRCPVYLVCGLYRGGDRYDVHCELFAERVELPRGGREQALVGYAQRYAERLEHYCKLDHRNWFNFYDFWDTGESGPSS